MSTLRAATKTTNLGRYHVVQRLAAGGMADVLLARTDGIEGFERHVVIKRIHADLLDEERYVKMFLDEARLAASLHHHNIVQVNDIGIEDGEYFFAMEYVHGEDARNLLVQSSKQGALLPLEHVITIVSAAAAGLHHAHEQCGPDRSPLHIVHRDVSPANILIGFDGSVKVADFGIAHAAHRKETTQSGVLKGKVAYMSPEQCNCERVDRRSDVFSLGIVLYELATVHPCFAGENDFMTMSAIVSGSVRPPSKLNASVAPALEAIIMKALAPSPSDRYQTADEMRVALEQYASDAGLRSSTNALADFMKQQFGTRPLPWQVDERGGEAAEPDGDELEITIATNDEPVAAVVDDDELSIPVEAPGRQRPVKETMPLRALHRVAMPALTAPAERHASHTNVEARRAAELTPPTTTTPTTPPTEPPATITPTTTSGEQTTPTEHTTVPQATRAARRSWLAIAIAAVVVSGASFVIANRGDEPAKPSARTGRPHVTPLPAPHLSSAPVVENAPVVAPVAAPAAEPAVPPARNPPRKAAKPAPSDSSNWNRNSLFPK